MYCLYNTIKTCGDTILHHPTRYMFACMIVCACSRARFMYKSTTPHCPHCRRQIARQKNTLVPTSINSVMRKLYIPVAEGRQRCIETTIHPEIVFHRPPPARGKSSERSSIRDILVTQRYPGFRSETVLDGENKSLDVYCNN